MAPDPADDRPATLGRPADQPAGGPGNPAPAASALEQRGGRRRGRRGPPRGPASGIWLWRPAWRSAGLRAWFRPRPDPAARDQPVQQRQAGGVRRWPGALARHRRTAGR
ncbi:hypothetical protein G6F23_015105 [Rhizopus arrhizus]|nr:hypothetical protein G6F23_015105 [Rhizopus arrhizus]